MLVQSFRKGLIGLCSSSVKTSGFYVQACAVHAEPRFIWFKLLGCYSALGREKPTQKLEQFRKILLTRGLSSSVKSWEFYRYGYFYIDLIIQGHVQTFYIGLDGSQG